MAYRMASLLAALLLSLALPALSGPWLSTAHAAARVADISDNWPTFMHDNLRTGASADTSISTRNAGQLAKLWSYQTGGMISAQPAIVNSVVYLGSWDGYEYALDAATGAVLWKTFLGITTASPVCFPSQLGISSSATVQNGVVYVGGGDAYWYALDAATGAVLWKVITGDNSATGGHYNWSSPLIYNGYAYIGIASLGDCPLVQGQLLQVNLSTQQVVATLNLVPNGQTGAGVWTSPTLDAATNTIYITTGTISLVSQTLAQAIVAVDASTLTIKSSWQVPQQETVLDSDWGTSPVLSTDAAGDQFISAINKNGYVYTFNRANVGAGPIWRQHIFLGGDCPTCGDGSVSNLTFGNGLLYAAGGNAVTNGVGHAGSVFALDPATGNIAWQHGDPAPVIPALTYDHGMVIAGAGSTLEVLDAATGHRLYSFTTGAVLYGPPSVASGTIYFGSGDGSIYALGLRNRTPRPLPPDQQCPSGWTCQDIGAPTPNGSESVSGSTWTITAGGAGVAGASDQFRLIAKTAAGDSQIAAQVSALSSGQAGIMFRQSNSPGSPYYAVFMKPGNIAIVQYRTRFGGVTTTPKTITAALPRYLEIQRSGDQFQVATSADGITYSLIPGTNATIMLPYAAMAGVATSSGTNGTAGAATVSEVALATISDTLNPAPSAAPCPSTWTCADVGNPAKVGDQALNSGVWTLSGAGVTFNTYADQFHYVWQSLTGDVTVNARVTAQTNTSGSAVAGVMLRQNASAGAAFYAAFITPGNGVVVLYRSVQGLRVVQQAANPGAVPVYLQIARSGSSFSTYSSSDGINWSYVNGTSVIISMSGTVLAGLAISSANTGTIGSATMDSVALSNTAPPPPVACPANWTCADIGNPSLSGGESLSNGVWSIEGAGNDIWGLSDQFHYDWQTLTADGAITAHVASQQQNTDTWAKAGLMLRLSTDPAAPYYAIYVTPANGIVIQYRALVATNAQQVSSIAGGAPAYLRVQRSGTTYSAYTSADGITWTLVAGSAAVIPSLTGSLLAGLAVASHNAFALNLTTFDSVTIAPTCPTGWTCADVGNPALAGSESVSNGVWTVQGAGGDIWSASDQFRYEWQTLAADGSISANVTSQTSTSVWAKAGVMLRATNDPGSPYYALLATPGNGIVLQYRTSQGAQTAQIAIVGAAPVYLMVARSGNVFNAYTSADGITWSPLPGSTVTLANLSGVLLAGLAVTSHNSGTLCAVTFQSVSLS